MKRLIVDLAGLVEAEGRSLRSSVLRVARLLLALLGAWLAAVAGIALFVGAAFFALEPVIGTALTLLVCGLVSLGVAGGAVWSVRREIR